MERLEHVNLSLYVFCMFSAYHAHVYLPLYWLGCQNFK